VTRRGRAVVRALAFVCLLAAVVCVASALRDDRPAAATATEPDAGLTTPAFSPRRTPALFVDAVGRTRLQQAVTGAVAGPQACVTVETAGGTRLAGVANDTPLAPASNQKLLIAAAALDVLGPDHRLATRAVTDAAVEDGTVQGDLVLVGGGDPLLATAPYEAWLHGQSRFREVPVTRLADLADAIAAAGISRIDGAIVVDDSRYDTERYNVDWKSNYVPDGESGPIGALTVDGGWVDPAEVVTADDPAVLAGDRLAELLEARGVDVANGVTRGTAADGSREVAAVQSVPVSDLVGEMLRASDNYTAELLVREIAAGTGAAEGASTAAGLTKVVDHLEALGVATAGVELVDGSGLAPSNRVTCDAIAGVLRLTGRKPFDAILSGLPVAATSGTLATRFVGDPLAGVLRAKTGEIDSVVGLSGMVDDAEHLRFAFLANGDFSTDGGRALQGAVARAVASYPDVTDAATLVPPPEPAS
jgi:D-alanyl-D-alanine carboxypeptidase/D-alanyl-D-alanine-endopeptidase (penicillin-binding protein 4)